MIGLNRELAPISDQTWKHIEGAAREVLRAHLVTRRLCDFVGPLGWSHSAIDLGRLRPLEGRLSGGASVRIRSVRPLIELRVPFALDRAELELLDRGARRVDLEPAREAARLFALAEDTALFEGYADADIPGIAGDSSHEAIPLPEDALAFPDVIADALERLRRAAVAGPYALALGPEPHAALGSEAGEGGYPVLRHVERLIDGPVLWAPALRGGVLLSQRGGDFRLVCGRDAAIGYASHDEKQLRLYLEESFSAELISPEAAVPLLPASE